MHLGNVHHSRYMQIWNTTTANYRVLLQSWRYLAENREVCDGPNQIPTYTEVCGLTSCASTTAIHLSLAGKQNICIRQQLVTNFEWGGKVTGAAPTSLPHWADFVRDHIRVTMHGAGISLNNPPTVRLIQGASY